MHVIGKMKYMHEKNLFSFFTLNLLNQQREFLPNRNFVQWEFLYEDNLKYDWPGPKLSEEARL